MDDAVDMFVLTYLHPSWYWRRWKCEIAASHLLRRHQLRKIKEYNIESSFSVISTNKAGYIHGYPSRVRVGRSRISGHLILHSCSHCIAVQKQVRPWHFSLVARPKSCNSYELRAMILSHPPYFNKCNSVRFWTSKKAEIILTS